MLTTGPATPQTAHTAKRHQQRLPVASAVALWLRDPVASCSNRATRRRIERRLLLIALVVAPVFRSPAADCEKLSSCKGGALSLRSEHGPAIRNSSSNQRLPAIRNFAPHRARRPAGPYPRRRPAAVSP